ncbi:MAG: hypothetical protein LBT44_04545 [Clostridiales bacterium]|nr:hypothetical protein [Clostridiales bacterium]MDR3239336.1 hypothetical protein [Clostridiales bacterium]
MSRILSRQAANLIAKALASVLLFSMLFALPPFAPIEAGAAAVSTLQIGTAEEFMAFAKSVNDGKNYAGSTVKLTNDINVSSAGLWTPIGNSSAHPFSGVFDGQNFTVSGLWIFDRTVAQQDGVGLFGTIQGAVIQNLTVVTTTGTNMGVNSGSAAAAVVGSVIDSAAGQASVIKNVHATAQITGTIYPIGVLIGKVDLSKSRSSITIQDCSAAGSVKSEEGGYAGGLVGAVFCKYGEGAAIQISDCKADVELNTKGNYTGGFAGLLENTGKSTNALVKNCTAAGSVTGGGLYTGGFAGAIRDISVKDCTVVSFAVYGKGAYTGGFAGMLDNSSSDFSIEGCVTGEDMHYNPTSVSGGSGYTGGFVGLARGVAISSSHAGGGAFGKGVYVGGFVGALEQAQISNCYEKGAVVSTGFSVGGFAGLMKASTLETCFAVGGASSTDTLHDNNTGGFAGTVNESVMHNCYVSGYVYGEKKDDSTKGAFIGSAAGNTQINDCYYDPTPVYGMQTIGAGETSLRGALQTITTTRFLTATGLGTDVLDAMMVHP